MTCSEFVEQVSNYLDGVVPPRRRAQIDAHLQDCPGCRAALAQFRTVIAAAGRLREADVATIDDATLASLVKAFASHTN